MPEHVLGQQDSDHFFPVVADHGKAGMAAFDDGLQQLIPRRIPFEDGHLGPGHHDIPNLGLGHRQHAFEHGQLVRIQNGLGMGLAEPVEEIVAGCSLALEHPPEAAVPGPT